MLRGLTRQLPHQASCSKVRLRKMCHFIHQSISDSATTSMCRNFGVIQRCPSFISVKRLLTTMPHKTPSPWEQSIIEAAEKRKQQRDILREMLEDRKTLSSEEWINVKEKVISTSDSINTANIDGIIMNLCITLRSYETGRSYIEYLITSQQKINVATKAAFLKLCFVCRENADVDKELILTFYDNLRSEYEVFNSLTAESLLEGLSLTDRWKDCVDLFEMIKEFSIPSKRAYSAISWAALKNNKFEEGLQYMEQTASHYKTVYPYVLHEYLNYCERHKNLNIIDLLEKLLNLFAVYDVMPSKDVVVRIKSIFDQFKWQTSFTLVSNWGFCLSCKKPLPRVPLSKEEFNLLRSTFLEKILIGSDVFKNTTPKEMEAFKEFLRNTKPYNLVCDGLNVSHRVREYEKNPANFSKCLRDVLEHCIANSKRVLILGRKHMMKWPKANMDFIYRNSQIFLADNLSEDDPFLLYATLYGGPGTCFMSGDLMRPYAYLLQESDLKSCFRRWQQQHQYLVSYNSKHRRKVSLQPPLQFNPSAQCGTDGSWHIPYIQEYTAYIPDSLEPPEYWLCLRRLT